MTEVLHNPNCFVVTGGPGVGKTTLLRELETYGILCVTEAARQIIREQVSTGGDAVPWASVSRYAELMLERSIANFKQHSATARPTFFDRGIPDVLCYARLTGLREGAIRLACDEYRYNRLIFIAPPWEEIYTADAERKQTFGEAVETYRVMTETYRDCGYEVAELPRANAKMRAEFVLDSIGNRS